MLQMMKTGYNTCFVCRTGDEDEDWTTSADAVVELIISLQQQQDNLVAEFFLWCLGVCTLNFIFES